MEGLSTWCRTLSATLTPGQVQRETSFHASHAVHHGRRLDDGFQRKVRQERCISPWSRPLEQATMESLRRAGLTRLGLACPPQAALAIQTSRPVLSLHQDRTRHK